MPWFEYAPITGGGHMPQVDGKLGRNGQDSFPQRFVVDSGAAYSFVPRVNVGYLIRDLDGRMEEDIGAKDANGNRMTGISVEFDVVLRNTNMPPML